MVSILFRSLDSEGDAEFESASKHFGASHVKRLVTDFVGHPDLVIGRYSVLPNYPEVEANLTRLGCRLVNNWLQHKYIADFDYYADLNPPGEEGLTAETFVFGTTEWAMAEDKWIFDQEGNETTTGWVVKGATNSQKYLWNTRMFAEDKFEANKIAVELQRDSMIGQQKILMRRYLPFRKLDEGINGLPITNEHRIFFLYGKLVDMGFYWATHEDLLADFSKNVFCPPSGFDVAAEAARRLAPNVNFFAVDIAELDSGEWKVVEVNEGQCAGLSCIDPDEFYQNLQDVVGV